MKMRRSGRAHGLSFVPTDGAKSVEAGVLRERDGTSLINAAKGAPVRVLPGGYALRRPLRSWAVNAPLDRGARVA
ncbi:hypothetical protein Taro_026916 [Colocasia esculenta]|uniref:Uncharacterized protein n=1 Tax=Colocasia esculenta TaxID=4460 RepID=A0A843VM32_COLES|nr:hypothetical protein [Colocasia esculenta]